MIKPEYFFQSHKILGVILDKFLSSSATKTEFITEQLPWGLEIRARQNEEHGKILKALGVIDLGVTEALWRLTKKDDLALDVGANIGYMTSILAVGVGENGRVKAFEAHPEIFEELKFNVQTWSEKKAVKIKNIDIEQVAISDSVGEVCLYVPLDFIDNRGIASVTVKLNASTSITVPSITLDAKFPVETIGVMKLDVEGHELNVLEGADKILHEKRIRDCVFEEHENYPTKVTNFLEKMDYKIFRIHRHFLGLELLSPDSKVERLKWLPTSFLATTEPERAIKLCQVRGWSCLSRIRSAI
jgi:FkbM family methyltransferase